MKKKVIFFCPSIEDGGVEKNLYLVVNKLSEEFEVSLITANKDKKNRFNKKINFIAPKNFNITNVARLIKTFYCVYLTIKKFYFKNKEIIIISYESNIFAIIVAKLLRVPVMIRSNASPTGYLENFLKIHIFKFFFKLADIILVNSSEFKTQIDKILNIKSKIIYNSIIEKSKKKKLSSQKIKEYKIDKNCYKIVVIGRLVEQKDQITILKALNLLKNKLNFFALIIGKGELKDDLIKFCNKNKISHKIKFLGYKNNIYPYLKWSDTLILSSKFEGSPNVLIEAISFKKTIISSNCPTGPKEILNNGKGGFLFETSNFKDLAKKIEISYFNKKLSHKKIKFSQKKIYRFDIDKNKNELIKLINSLK